MQGLVGGCLQALQAYTGFQSSYGAIELTIASMKTQCSCMGIVLSEIRNLLNHDKNRISRFHQGTQLREQFDFVLGACLVVFAILREKLDRLIGNDEPSERRFSVMEKVKLVWNQQEMKDLLQNIQGQAFAVNLLLSALQTSAMPLAVWLESALTRLGHHRQKCIISLRSLCPRLYSRE